MGKRKEMLVDEKKSTEEVESVIVKLDANNLLEPNSEQAELINLFVNFSKPFVDKVGGPKLECMLEYFREKNIDAVYEEGIGIIANKQENPRVVCVTHMDLIKRFQKGFAKDEVCAIVDDTYIIGALDNTITNASAALTLEKLLENNITDVEVLFSEGEEVGFHGMIEYLKIYKDKAEGTFFVNLDVTNEGWKKYGSIEYDKPNFKMLKKVQKILKGKKMFFTDDRVCDDTDAIVNRGFCGFSYCLPTKNNIHSYNNKAKLKALLPYKEGLYAMLSEITYKSKPEKDLYYGQFEEALKVNKKSELKERKKPTSSWSHSDFESNSDIWDTKYSDGLWMDTSEADVDFDFESFSEEENVTSIMMENLYGISITNPTRAIDRFFKYRYDENKPIKLKDFMKIPFEDGDVSKEYKKDLFDEIYEYLYGEGMVTNIDRESYIFVKEVDDYKLGTTFKKVYDDHKTFSVWWDNDFTMMVKDLFFAGEQSVFEEHDFSLVKSELRTCYREKMEIDFDILKQYVPGDLDTNLFVKSLMEILT